MSPHHKEENVIPIGQPRVVPDGVEQHPVVMTVVCTVVVGFVFVTWWVGLSGGCCDGLA